MSKLVNVYFPDMPQYLDLVSFDDKPKETPQEATKRLIDKINEANGGDDL